ncbi:MULTISPECIES: glycosyltransferase family 4 protein [unclassified Coleofasciculus]|uniref:glycosyltransferase family 4 protein n=1 Tax=unclassified Coleofasciculus TaxID=2692782 RepID=UPI001881D118|nr:MULTISPECIES: glycosyltransferase family 4 protein [unclassified Coleofasciculus]MBE9127552.1 glycosyltransferase family 4 protein [Coleofasciculus sp. LEGE 07081]MBE9147204.1 glycosyltransferase family 4 protein [Coleofasciculus sp. LEGE 07092]
MKLLYYSPASYGGIADYAHEQANALGTLGVDVTFLCTPNYPTGRGETYKVMPILQDITFKNLIPHKILKSVHFSYVILTNFNKLARFIEKNGYQYVLLGSYVEYLAPIWSGRLRKLAKKGVIFSAVVHDPVRNFVVGPRWWHRWSIACGYSFLREAFVHEAIELDTIRSMPQLQTTVVPHGTYCFPDANQSREKTRASLDLTLDAKLMLAFGHIRDNKNLDLVIRAMVNFPDLYLLVAGKEQSSGQRPAAFYQQLATNLGVANRCRWKIQFIPDMEVANFFLAADLILLTYSKTFHSASGVLNAAVSYRKPCLASAGGGFLYSVIRTYKLGIGIEADDVDSIVNGIRRWLENSPSPQWERYCKEKNWKLNAELVIARLGYI